MLEPLNMVDGSTAGRCRDGPPSQCVVLVRQPATEIESSGQEHCTSHYRCAGRGLAREAAES